MILVFAQEPVIPNFGRGDECIRNNGNFCVKCAEELLSLQHAGTNRRKELERRILAFVGKRPGGQTTKRQIYRALQRHYSDAAEFGHSFRALVNAGELFAEPGTKGSYIVSIP